MTLTLDFHPAVRDEIDAAHDWYEQRQPGLGDDFLDEVEQVIAEISVNPADTASPMATFGKDS